MMKFKMPKELEHLYNKIQKRVDGAYLKQLRENKVFIAKPKTKSFIDKENARKVTVVINQYFANNFGEFKKATKETIKKILEEII